MRAQELPKTISLRGWPPGGSAHAAKGRHRVIKGQRDERPANLGRFDWEGKNRGGCYRRPCSGSKPNQRPPDRDSFRTLRTYDVHPLSETEKEADQRRQSPGGEPRIASAALPPSISSRDRPPALRRFGRSYFARAAAYQSGSRTSTASFFSASLNAFSV